MSFKKMLKIIKKESYEVFKVELAGSADKAKFNDKFKDTVTEF